MIDADGNGWTTPASTTTGSPVHRHQARAMRTTQQQSPPNRSNDTAQVRSRTSARFRPTIALRNTGHWLVSRPGFGPSIGYFADMDTTEVAAGVSIPRDGGAAARRRGDWPASRTRTPVLTSGSLDGRTGDAEGGEPAARGGVQVPRRLQQDLDALTGQARRGVCTWSSSNHCPGSDAVGVAGGIACDDLIPEDAPVGKRAVTEGYVATVLTYDRYGEDRQTKARECAAAQRPEPIPRTSQYTAAMPNRFRTGPRGPSMPQARNESFPLSESNHCTTGITPNVMAGKRFGTSSTPDSCRRCARSEPVSPLIITGRLASAHPVLRQSIVDQGVPSR